MQWSGLSFPELERQLVADGLAEVDRRTRWLKCRFGKKAYYVAFYKGGRFLITGASSVSESMTRFAEVVARVQSVVPIFVAREFVVQNIVFSGRWKLRGNLESIFARLPGTYETVYEPEQFPALQVARPPVTFLLYSTGSYVLTGVRSQEQAQSAAADLEACLTSIGAVSI